MSETRPPARTPARRSTRRPAAPPAPEPGNLKAELGRRTGRWVARAAQQHPPSGPHPADPRPDAGSLENAIGREVRRRRESFNLTLSKLANAAGMSTGMLSKIENGTTSPSLSSLRALASALHIPITALFHGYEETLQAAFVRQGQGVEVERRGTASGHRYNFLGYNSHGDLDLEPYIVTLSRQSKVFPLFQHEGLEFIYMLEGEMRYRHGGRSYDLAPGDSLMLDGRAVHGPEALRTLPIRFLCVMASSQR